MNFDFSRTYFLEVWLGVLPGNIFCKKKKGRKFAIRKFGKGRWIIKIALIIRTSFLFLALFHIEFMLDWTRGEKSSSYVFLKLNKVKCDFVGIYHFFWRRRNFVLTVKYRRNSVLSKANLLCCCCSVFFLVIFFLFLFRKQSDWF